MRLFEAYEKAEREGKKLRRPNWDQGWVTVETLNNNDLGIIDSLANDWEVEVEQAVEVLPSKFKEVWNNLSREFTTVKPADESRLYKRLSEELFRQR